MEGEEEEEELERYVEGEKEGEEEGQVKQALGKPPRLFGAGKKADTI